MEIAKGINATEYINLNLKDYSNSDWDYAISILDKRLTDRYLEPVEILIDAEKNKPLSEKKFGFTVLAIDCLIVETLQSFYEGVTDSTGLSKKLFRNFLRQRINFKTFFTNDADADYFFSNYRCGILHQAQTFNNSKVWTVGQLIVKQGDGFIVNRDLFHKAIKNEKDIYINLLYQKSDTAILDKFKTKMDFISKLQSS
ncbi:hypothetical protein [Mucilaginibacter sp. 10B2]|uniref:hypothetical protein n=1 Tax=Mucilaginibacter sp. 10B2 TaxID=3048574 RepID=UPI002B23268A|nr:hypothetical protein [Mucilaginibacter sp. 10B2]MEB0277187.1 hypothetical protein [Mucilaginibacter sp. 10B2]